jgi:3-isopropylmalate/(R)-2-methylmalate dehydratase small subunit
MEPFHRLEAVALPLAAPNVDTDQIVPARFLRKPRSAGYAPFLFHDLRFDDQGNEKADFVLNRAPFRKAQVLVTERNFGCGSSREQAVWALFDYGFRAVVAPSFGDIFFNNCFKIGVLPIVLSNDDATALRTAVERQPDGKVGVDLEAQRVTGPDGKTYGFDVDPFRKDCLLRGVDEIDFTLGHMNQIEAYEKTHA